MFRHRMLIMLLVILLSMVPPDQAHARAKTDIWQPQDECDQVEQNLRNEWGGNLIVSEKKIDEDEYLGAIMAMAETIEEEDAAPLQRYFGDLVESIMDDVIDQVPELGEQALIDLMIQSLFGGSVGEVGRLQLKAGLARCDRFYEADLGPANGVAQCLVEFVRPPAYGDQIRTLGKFGTETLDNLQATPLIIEKEENFGIADLDPGPAVCGALGSTCEDVSETVQDAWEQIKTLPQESLDLLNNLEVVVTDPGEALEDLKELSETLGIRFPNWRDCLGKTEPVRAEWLPLFMPYLGYRVRSEFSFPDVQIPGLINEIEQGLDDLDDLMQDLQAEGLNATEIESRIGQAIADAIVTVVIDYVARATPYLRLDSRDLMEEAFVRAADQLGIAPSDLSRLSTVQNELPQLIPELLEQASLLLTDNLQNLPGSFSLDWANSNAPDVRRELAKDGWHVVYGLLFSESDWLEVGAAVVLAPETGGASLSAYFTEYAYKTLAILQEQVPDITVQDILDLLQETLESHDVASATISGMRIEVNIATYNRDITVPYPVLSARECWWQLGSLKTKGFCTQNEGTGNIEINLPNHHQPYFRLRFANGDPLRLNQRAQTDDELKSIFFPNEVASNTSNGNTNIRMTVRTGSDERLVVRTLPSLSAPEIVRLYNGDSYDVIGKTQDREWLNIRLNDGASGWVRARFTRITGSLSKVPVTDGTVAVETPPEAQLTVNTGSNDRLIVRSGPGRTFSEITRIANGERYRVLGRDRSLVWLNVLIRAGQEGWVMREYAELNTPARRIPVTDGSTGQLIEGRTVMMMVATGTNDRMIVRSEPNPQGTEITRIYNGESYPVVARVPSGVWIKIQLEPGREGWVRLEFAQITGTLANVPMLNSSGTGVVVVAPGNQGIGTLQYKLTLPAGIAHDTTCGGSFLTVHVYAKDGTPLPNILIAYWDVLGNSTILATRSQQPGYGSIRVPLFTDQPHDFSVMVVDGNGRRISQEIAELQHRSGDVGNRTCHYVLWERLD